MKKFKVVSSIISLIILIMLFIVLAKLNTNMNNVDKLLGSVYPTSDGVKMNCNSSSISVNDEISCELTGYVTGHAKGVSGIVTTTGGLEVKSINVYSDTWTNNASTPELNLSCNQDSGATLSEQFGIATITVKATSAGEGTINFVGTSSNNNEVMITNEEDQNVGVSNATYGVSVAEPKSTESRLKSLNVTGGASLSFKSNTYSYSVTVGNSVSSVNISAEKMDDNARILEGTGTKNLNVGDNVVNIIVVAEDGVTKSTYTVNIHRDISAENRLTSLSVSDTVIANKFNIDVTSYSETVVYGTTSVSIRAVSLDSNASISLDGTSATGTLSVTKNLSIGANTFNIIVTAPNTATKTYTIKVIRESKDGSNKSSDSTLKSLKITNTKIESSFKSTTYNYEESVDYNISSVKITATANNSKATIPATSTGTKSLKVGTNKFEIPVTAENGSSTTYIVKIKRKTQEESSGNSKSSSSSKNQTGGSSTKSTTVSPTATTKTVKKENNSLLKSLTINNKSIMLSDSVYKYNFSVLNNVTKLNVVAVPKADKSTVVVDKPDKLKVGTNTITIKVTAESKSTTTYKINVTRKDINEELDNDSSLLSMSIENYDIDFDSDKYEYTVKIKDESSLSLSYVTNGINTNVIVKNNENLKNGSTVSVVVTAEDGVSTSTYNIVVKKGISPFIIIIPIALLLGIGTAVYFLLIKKKKTKVIPINQDINEEASTDSDTEDFEKVSEESDNIEENQNN